jgi:manganese-dependent ADP-ribose/CDP-alcohol diphosphatase
MRDAAAEISRRRFLRIAGTGAVCLGFDGRIFAGETRGGKPELTFGVLADAQYADADRGGSRYYRQSVRKLAECVKDLNARALRFTIHLGDFIDRGFASFGTLGPVYGRLTMPHYHVLGNHDFSVDAKDKARVVGVLGLDKLGSRTGHYDFAVGRWRFVVLNGTDVSTYANPKGSEKRKQAEAALLELKRRKARNARPWNGGLGARQLTWLRRTLGEAATAGQRVVLFCHMPVYPPNAHNLFDDGEVLKTIDANRNVVAYVNGHNHAGNYAARKGVHYLTIKGMVEQQTNSYGVIEVHSDHLRLIGFGREIGRTMPAKR